MGMEALVLTLDLSTTCTGWALFHRDTKKLLNYGFIKPVNKGLAKLSYPKKQLYKMRTISDQILSLIDSFEGIQSIIIEEVNLHKSRMTGKTLDGMHWVLLENMPEETLDKVKFMDSDGPVGWRTRLALKMTDDDRRTNKERKRLNTGLPKGSKKLPIINKKHLACRYVNGHYGMAFDVDKNTNDNDVVDAIGLGIAYLLDK